MPRQETCWNCGGSGQEAVSSDSATYASGASTSAGKSGASAGMKPGKPKAPWTRDQTVVFVLAYVASTWGLIEYAKLDGWAPYFVALFPAFVIARTWKGLATFVLVAGGLLLLASLLLER
ncbi:hypothetical protein ACFFTN_10355 [Aminobacter aganoensis]|uniref:Uncharacterized protein n=2 Tax=Aminobacter aganoensis TaxID=83264 RepID=A0A7X0KMS6_9HYPH|nr:hypothetical protein [Aminobacter aganoensis]MBB6356431.1 hypothetical protein [Aminobacter aganoensis]